ncbi:MAG: NAD-dependent epimerase/dehydratase family protein [Proteobacteria bacterium]|nr:MAG: NAD-dependent epimerase/dehydratase family protein [Pseudomonadota bacterium]
MLELWGGVECTINRVDNEYLNQLRKSGHDERSEDLKLFSELGLRTLRFPIIWEQHAPDSPEEFVWTFADERLSLARSLGIRPIVGFVHHGSGPLYTDLLDEGFPQKLELFARAFAERYPWVDAYTPINEPLTTARFSGLYGCWYPHRRDNTSFLRMLLHECLATRAVMNAVRVFNPSAEFIQTDDLGKIFSTRFLAYQAEFENHRRWLSFDLLAGRVDSDHALYAFCLKNGLTADELSDFVHSPCVPDMIGINHYVTSNRFLDERLERYPKHVHGGNGRHYYADIEAVRVGAEIVSSPKELLREAWERYRIPLAVTEVHLGCTREEQLRWLKEVWDAALALQTEGVDIRAVTAWSLLGAYDWNSLVTRNDGVYESGVFDLRGGKPRLTQLAHMLTALSKGEDYDHPVLDCGGWWQRPERLLYPSVNLGVDTCGELKVSAKKRVVLITGAPGKLAMALSYVCERRAIPFRLLTRRELDLRHPQKVRSFLGELHPWAIIHAAGYSDVERAQTEREECFGDNVLSTLHLAEYCAEHHVKFLNFSSEHVFDGLSRDAYVESSEKNPQNVYGTSQHEAEKILQNILPSALTVRTSTLFGPWDEDNILTSVLRCVTQGEMTVVPSDFIVSPTYIPELCDVALDLFLDDEKGVWHLAHDTAIDWASFVRLAFTRYGLDHGLLRGGHRLAGQRPAYAPLRSERAQLMQPLESAMENFYRDCRINFQK